MVVIVFSVGCKQICRVPSEMKRLMWCDCHMERGGRCCGEAAGAAGAVKSLLMVSLSYSKIKETLNTVFPDKVLMACAREAQTHLFFFSPDRGMSEDGFCLFS